MSLKERMKVWQQVTSPKIGYTPPPVVAPKIVASEPKPVEKIQPVHVPSVPVSASSVPVSVPSVQHKN